MAAPDWPRTGITTAPANQTHGGPRLTSNENKNADDDLCHSMRLSCHHVRFREGREGDEVNIAAEACARWRCRKLWHILERFVSGTIPDSGEKGWWFFPGIVRTTPDALEGEFPTRGNKRAARGNGGLPRLGHSFHLIVTGIAFPRIPKSKVDRRAALSPASPLLPMQYARVR